MPSIISWSRFGKPPQSAASRLCLYLELIDGRTAVRCGFSHRWRNSADLGYALAAQRWRPIPAPSPVSNTWYAFEFEIVINNTTGSASRSVRTATPATTLSRRGTEYTQRHDQQLREQVHDRTQAHAATQKSTTSSGARTHPPSPGWAICAATPACRRAMPACSSRALAALPTPARSARRIRTGDDLRVR